MERVQGDAYREGFERLIQGKVTLKRCTLIASKTKIRLREIRLKKGLSVRKLADYLQRTVQSVYQWENPNDKRLPSVFEIVTLSGLYEVNVEDLLHIEETQG